MTKRTPRIRGRVHRAPTISPARARPAWDSQTACAVERVMTASAGQAAGRGQRSRLHLTGGLPEQPKREAEILSKSSTGGARSRWASPRTTIHRDGGFRGIAFSAKVPPARLVEQNCERVHRWRLAVVDGQPHARSAGQRPEAALALPRTGCVWQFGSDLTLALPGRGRCGLRT